MLFLILVFLFLSPFSACLSFRFIFFSFFFFFSVFLVFAGVFGCADDEEIWPYYCNIGPS